MTSPNKPIARRRGLPRWTNHLAIWVVLGGVAGVTQCRRRPYVAPSVDRTALPSGSAARRGRAPAVAQPPRRTDLVPTVVDLGRSADAQLVRHVVGL